jgi:hypothetical protein
LSLGFATLPIVWRFCPIWGTPVGRGELTNGVVVGLPYIVVYEIDQAMEEVAIIAVFHGAQDRDDSM